MELSHSERLDRIEKRLDHIEAALETGKMPKKVHAMEQAQPEQSSAYEHPRDVAPVLTQSEEKEKERIRKEMTMTMNTEPVSKFWAWLKEDWLMKAGALFLLLALSWFVRYAFIQNWIGPDARIALGVITGAAVFGFGYWYTKKNSIPGQVLVATGGAMILGTIFIARGTYDIFSPALALALMTITMLSMFTVSVKLPSEPLAIISVFGAAIAPFLTNSSDPNFLMLFVYIAILNLVVYAIESIRGWSSVNFITLIITVGYTLLMDPTGDHFLLWEVGDTARYLLLGVFTAQFFASLYSNIAVNKKRNTYQLFSLGLATLTTLFWIGEYIPDGYQAGVTLAVAIALYLAAFALHNILKADKNLFLINFAISSIFLITATAYAFDDAPLRLVFAAETIALMLIGRYYTKDDRAILLPAFFSLVPLLLSVFASDFSQYQWQKMDGLFNIHFMTSLVTMVMTGVVAYLCYEAFKWRKQQQERFLISGRLFVTIAWIALASWIWSLLHFLIDSSRVADTTSLFVYAVIVLGAFFYGSRMKKGSILFISSAVSFLVFLGSLVENHFNMFRWDSSELILNPYALGALVTIGLAGVLSFGFYQYIRDNNPEGDSYQTMGRVLAIIAWLSSASWMWLFIHQIVQTETVARGMFLVLYSIIGVTLFFYGRSTNKQHYIINSYAILILVILRLLLVEVWEMTIIGRVGTFLVVGLLLVSTAFFGKDLVQIEKK